MSMFSFTLLRRTSRFPRLEKLQAWKQRVITKNERIRRFHVRSDSPPVEHRKTGT